MKSYTCLTVLEPWASLITFGGKDVENRSQQTRYRGPLLIHAGQSMLWEGKRLSDPHEMGAVWSRARFAHPKLPVSPQHGRVVAVAHLVDCCKPEHCSGSEWIEGPWCWLLERTTALEHPFLARGGQGLFLVNESSIPAKSAAELRRLVDHKGVWV